MLTSSSIDVLSHVAIRARSQKVLLASCFDQEEFSRIKQLDGTQALASIDAAGSVAVTAADSEVRTSNAF